MVQKGEPACSSDRHPNTGKQEGACLREANARRFIERYRARLTWLAHIPEWEEWYAKGLDALRLPGASQGISLRGRLNALPLTHKYQLFSWVAEEFRGQMSTRVVLRMATDWGIDIPPSHTLDQFVSGRVWQEFCEDFVLHMGVEHRRYQEHQGLLFEQYHYLIQRSIQRVVFDARKWPDAMQEGALGLLTAIDHISGDMEQGFVSYAQSWIVRYVRNYLLRERFIVHVPVNLAMRTLSGESEKKPEKETRRKSRQTAREAADQLLQAPVYLDAPIEDGNTTMDLADPDTLDQESGNSQEELKLLIRKGLESLTDKQREVIEARYGLKGDGEPQTLEVISQRIGITHQQVSQREKRALQRLEQALKPLLPEVLSGY
jgi:RNA polymerase sigma factor (sigma-70 family)